MVLLDARCRFDDHGLRLLVTEFAAQRDVPIRIGLPLFTAVGGLATLSLRPERDDEARDRDRLALERSDRSELIRRPRVTPCRGLMRPIEVREGAEFHGVVAARQVRSVLSLIRDLVRLLRSEPWTSRQAALVRRRLLPILVQLRRGSVQSDARNRLVGRNRRGRRHRLHIEPRGRGRQRYGTPIELHGEPENHRQHRRRGMSALYATARPVRLRMRWPLRYSLLRHDPQSSPATALDG